MKLQCVYCGKLIEGVGSIYNGEAYHDSCLKDVIETERRSMLSTLNKEFDQVGTVTLYNLHATHGRNLSKYLNSNWCIITKNLHDCDEQEIHTFKIKNEMIGWLEDEIDWALMEGYAFDVSYILRKGKVIGYLNDYTIKVSI